MSHESPDPPVRQMEDDLPTARLIWVAAITLLIFALGVVWAYGEWVYSLRADVPHGEAPLPAQIGEAQQGIVFQQPFDQLQEAQAARRAAEQRLGSYGWADRDRGLIHIPIGEAMQQYLEGRRP